MQERIAKLERRNRLMLGLVIASFVPWVLGAAAAPEIVQLFKAEIVASQQLVIVEDVNAEGKPVKRVLLGSESLTFMDKQGKPRLMLSVAENGTPFISLLDEKGRSTMLGIDAEGKVKTHIAEPKD